MIAHDAGTHAGACSHRQTGCAGSQLGLLGLPRQRSHASCRATSCTPAGPAYDKIFTIVTGPVMVRPIGPDHPAVLGRYADHCCALHPAGAPPRARVRSSFALVCAGSHGCAIFRLAATVPSAASSKTDRDARRVCRSSSRGALGGAVGAAIQGAQVR